MDKRINDNFLQMWSLKTTGQALISRIACEQGAMTSKKVAK